MKGNLMARHIWKHKRSLIAIERWQLYSKNFIGTRLSYTLLSLVFHTQDRIKALNTNS